MSYLVFIKSGGGAPGPQLITAPTEPNMAQVSSISVTTLNYLATAIAETAPSEPNMAQVSSLSITSFNYA